MVCVLLVQMIMMNVQMEAYPASMVNVLIPMAPLHVNVTQGLRAGTVNVSVEATVAWVGGCCSCMVSSEWRLG